MYAPQENALQESSPKRRDYTITNDDFYGVGGAKTKYTNNIAAIKTLKVIESENRLATTQEQETLVKYVGWGGLPQAFDSANNAWGKEYAELKSLLSEKEYGAARASAINAHYTSAVVIKAMYEVLNKLGFSGGNILEPSMGIGNFFGLLPENMSASKLFGVELDSITGRIARQLYQNAEIHVTGYENTSFPDNFFDAAIGNVPFGNYRVSDSKYDKLKLPIHDYFFAKTLDKVRPGGIIAFVTSTGTMDKKNNDARMYIAQRAELLGAIRLPNNAFFANAGTEVTTDILFLKKRDTITNEIPDWVHLGELDTKEGTIQVNRYFAENPHMLLGEMSHESRLYGRADGTSCKPYPNAVLSEQLAEAVNNIKGEYEPTAFNDTEREDEGTAALHGEDDSSSASAVTLPADPLVKNFTFTSVDGEIFYRENSVMLRQELTDTQKSRAQGLLELRDCVRSLIGAMLENQPDEVIKQLQGTLNGLYDSFTKKYGLINDKRNNSVFSRDSSYYLLCSLEVLDEDGKLLRKADMFDKRTISVRKTPDKADNAADALAISISERARVDLDYMSELTGFNRDKLLDDLRGTVFLNIGFASSQEKTYVTADEYLSGNVREKLRRAEAAVRIDPSLSVNVDALKAVLPRDLQAGEIDVRLGSAWIDKRYIQQFMHELFQTPHYLKGLIKVDFSEYTGNWRIHNKNSDNSGSALINTVYGTSRINAYHILEETLNLKSDIRIFDVKRDNDGERRVLNKKETLLATQKQEAVKQAFNDWLFKDPVRRGELVKTYNERFNSTREREYDGSHITFQGMNPEIELRPHQINAIARVLYGGNTLLAHEVGAGKTFEICASVMESKRLGLASKSLIVVPNHLTEQWASEFLSLYPAANLLVAKKKDFETKNRKKFCARIATGEYDAIIIGHSQFERIPMSKERREKFLHDEISEITDGIEQLKRQRGDSFSIKQLEITRKNLQVKLNKLHTESRKDDVITFEQLGVDRLFVDESHFYKNLFLYTKMRNVAGLSTSEAQKSSDLFMKCRYMDELTDNKGVIFATGTPLSNSMAELYTVMRYLQYDTLSRHGLLNFDSWASTFGETVTAAELSPEGGGYRTKTRFSKFFNLPELMTMFKEVADIKTADALDYLPKPKVMFETVVAKPSDIQKELIKTLSARASEVQAGNIDPREDNMLKITGDGRKIGLDARLINPLYPDNDGSKVNMCVQNVFDIWERTSDKRLTQLVFCDFSTPKADGDFDVYNDVKKKLIAKGVPENEIEFIHNAKTDEQKKALFSKMRNGSVRVLIGSTQKMGAGTNVQNRLIALHDLDCPWRPSDLSQRLGRIERQGNENPVVNVYRYVTEGSFDSYLYQTIENKQKFISQIMTSKSPVRSCEDVDESVLSYAEIKALCAGNPLVKEKMMLDVEINKLKMLKNNYQNERYSLQDKITKYFPNRIKHTEKRIEELRLDVETVSLHSLKSADKFEPMSISGIKYTEKDKAGEALLNALNECVEASGKSSGRAFGADIGEYCGFKMSVTVDRLDNEVTLTLSGASKHDVTMGGDAIGNITRINNRLAGIEERLKSEKAVLENYKTQLKAAETELDKPFPNERELTEKSARLVELNTLLSLEDKQKDEEDISAERRNGEQSANNTIHTAHTAHDSETHTANEWLEMISSVSSLKKDSAEHTQADKIKHTAELASR